MCEIRSFMLRILLRLSFNSSVPPAFADRTVRASFWSASSSFSRPSRRSSSFLSSRCNTSSCFCESLIDCWSFFFL
uniref:Putative secreted protein n=1 Tax=Anopheles marajoara TaxID=58244 RepID=A0A2M4CCT0_9DIPT